MFKTVLLFLLNSLFIMALELPKSIESRVLSIGSGREITISGNIPAGRTGVIIHDYGKSLKAITYRVTSKGGNRLSVDEYMILKHDNIPNIKTTLKVGDRVVVGNLYDNILLIAPNSRVYGKIVDSTPDRFWIHPDLYAQFYINSGADRVTIENIRQFATNNLIGLVAIVVKDGIKILDPISGKYIDKIPLKIDVDEAHIPFYARVNSHFIEKSGVESYYKMVEEIR